MGFPEDNHRDKVLFSSRHDKQGCLRWTGFLTDHVLDYVAEVVCFLGFSTVKLFFSSLSILSFLEGSHCAQPIVKGRRAFIYSVIFITVES